MKHAVVLFVLALAYATVSLNNRPIIGIFTQPTHNNPQGTDYLAASYVKFIESAGARVVPIRYNLSKPQLKDLFSQINGILFPGGGADISNGTQFFQAQYYMFQLAKEANDKGDYFPVWATCLGFEALGLMVAKDPSILTGGFDSWNLPIPLQYRAGQAKNSRLLGDNLLIMGYLGQYNITFNNHHYGFESGDWFRNRLLVEFFRVISVNEDRNGRKFISTIEAHEYPFYGVQWHPEKGIFEWTTREDIDHSDKAVITTQYLANFFVKEARKSNHQFRSIIDETKALIYNYVPVFSYKDGKSYKDFMQVYYFN